MRIMVLSIAALSLGSIGSAASMAEPSSPNNGFSDTDHSPDAHLEDGNLQELSSTSEECAQHTARASQPSDQRPQFRRGPAPAEKPMAIYAVDRREDGCPMIVMLGNPNDVRPLEVEQSPRATTWPAGSKDAEAY